MSVVGVDLGYQNSVVAAAGRGGVDVILNGNSNRLNPSMIGFGESRKMGEHANTGVTSNFKNTIKGMKRLIGLPFDSPSAKEEMKHYPGVTFVPHAKGSGPATIAVQVEFAGESKTLPIEHVAGMMIRHMGMVVAEKAAAESHTPDVQSCFPQDWVVSIPPYYTDAQRRALLAGCEMCGIPQVQRLMHESTATALAYGIFKDLKKEFSADKPTLVMFLDMGASAFNVSIASFETGKLKVLACHSDPNLGGRDFDLAIGNWIASKFEEKYAKKLSAKPMEKAKTRIKILIAAEKAKKTLSPHGVKEAAINLEMLQDDLDFSGKLSASDYEKMCQPLLDRLEAPILKCLAEAKVEARDLSVAEIVGGSTRINSVKNKLQKVLGISSLSTTMNADEAIARGAALQSAILSPRFKVLPYEISESQPYPIEISWGDAAAAKGGDDATSVVMFDRGLSFPVTRRVTLKKTGPFAVKAAYQSPQSTEEFGLDPALAGDGIADFSIQAPTDGEKKVRVNVKQDIHGIISLSSAQMVEEKEEEGKEGGEEKTEGEESAKKKKVTKTALEYSVTHPFEWSTAEVNKYHELEASMANTDRLVKETADMRNDLESYIYDMRDKVTSDSHLGLYGTEEEKAAFTKKNEEMENWLYEDGFDATKKVYAEKLAELKALGGPIEKRKAEADGRSTAQSDLQTTLEMYQKWANESQNDDKYAHISDEERQKVTTKCDEISAWMYDMMDKQGDLPVNADPIMTVAVLKAKVIELNESCGPIMRKPVPKKTDMQKAAEESNKKKEGAKEDPPPAGGEAPEPMDVDGGETPKEDGDKMDVE